MGQKHSCMKNEDAVQTVVNQALDGTTRPINNTGTATTTATEQKQQEGNTNLPRLDNPVLAKEPIITQVQRRHKGTRLPKQRELMVAGLQVRQQQGESIAYLLNSLPYGSIIQVESNTHLIVAQPVRRLQMSIYQNHLGNVQIATVTSQEGIVPPHLTDRQILVTVNGQTIKTVDQAVELLSKPEKLLLVIAEAPLEKKDRSQRKGTTRVVDIVLTKRDIRRQNSSLLSSPTDQEQQQVDDNSEEEERQRRRRKRRSSRRKHERRGSGNSHGSKESVKSHGSNGSSSSSRKSSKAKKKKAPSNSSTTPTPLCNQDKVLPTETIRRNSSSSSMSSTTPNNTNINTADVRDKIFVAKGKAVLEGAGVAGTGAANDEQQQQHLLDVSSNSTHPTVDSSDNSMNSETNKKLAKESNNNNILLNSTMDTANSTMISYEGDDGEFVLHTPKIISPSSSVASPTTTTHHQEVSSPTTPAFAPAIVTPSSQASVENVSKIADYDNDHPILFKTSSSDSESASSLLDKQARAAMYSMSSNDDEIARNKKILAKLEKYLDESMMELAFVMIEIEDIQAQDAAATIAGGKKKPAAATVGNDETPAAAVGNDVVPDSSMTAEKLEALEKDLRFRIFDILEARQRELQKQQQQQQGATTEQSSSSLLALPTIAEQDKAVLETTSTSTSLKEPPSSLTSTSSLKEPPCPPSKLDSVEPSSTTTTTTTTKMQDLEQQLLEMQSANKALKQELAQKDSQLVEFQELEKQAQQNKVSSTRIQ